jgi:outer membrane lipoprotein SlyB
LIIKAKIGMDMIPKFALTALLALSAFAPVEPASAQNSLGGAIFGGAAGAVVGGAVGGGRGAAIGAIVGATTGAAIASQGEPRQGGYYYYQNGCYVQRPDGAWIAVAPRYCGPY